MAQKSLKTGGQRDNQKCGFIPEVCVRKLKNSDQIDAESEELASRIDFAASAADYINASDMVPFWH